jgi:hypothetical protein
LAKKLGMKVSEKTLGTAVEDMAMGEKRSHRLAAMNHFAKRRGLKPQEAKEFSEYVENRFYGDPEYQRQAALAGWKKRRLYENPLWTPLVPEPWQSSLGLAEMEADAPHIAGIVVGLPTTILYSGIGELVTRNEWGGTFIGLGAGLIQSEATRRWWPAIGTTTEAEAIKQRAGFARGQRIAVYSVTGFRCATSFIKMAAGVGIAKGALRQGIDDVAKQIREGKLLDAIKIPFVMGSGLRGMGDIEFPKVDLPEGISGLGSDFSDFWDKAKKAIGLGEDKGIVALVKKHWPRFKAKSKKALPPKKNAEKAAAPKKGDAPAINAGEVGPIGDRTVEDDLKDMVDNLARTTHFTIKAPMDLACY